jgi:hypothetical protein
MEGGDPVPSMNNPAGRLYELLRAYKEAAKRNKSVEATWAEVLGVSPEEVQREMARVVQLIPELERAVDLYGDEGQQEVVAHNLRHWLAPLFAAHRSWGQTPSAGPALVDAGALAALNGMSSYLSRVAPEGAVPESDTVAELRDQAAGLLDQAASADDLHADVRRALVEHLYALQEALDHVRVGGPRAVALALQRLRCELRDESDSTKGHSVVRRVVDLGTRVWTVFSLGGPATAEAIAAWGEVLKALPPG